MTLDLVQSIAIVLKCDWVQAPVQTLLSSVGLIIVVVQIKLAVCTMLVQWKVGETNLIML